MVENRGDINLKTAEVAVDHHDLANSVSLEHRGFDGPATYNDAD